MKINMNINIKIGIGTSVKSEYTYNMNIDRMINMINVDIHIDVDFQYRCAHKCKHEFVYNDTVQCYSIVGRNPSNYLSCSSDDLQQPSRSPSGCRGFGRMPVGRALPVPGRTAEAWGKCSQATRRLQRMLPLALDHSHSFGTSADSGAFS